MVGRLEYFENRQEGREPKFAGKHCRCTTVTRPLWPVMYKCKCALCLLTLTLKTSSDSQALSCIMSFTQTLIVANILQSSAIPPGLSLRVAWNFTNRPSMANPRSRHLLNTEVSMFPPHSNNTTLRKIKKKHIDKYDVFINLFRLIL